MADNDFKDIRLFVAQQGILLLWYQTYPSFPILATEITITSVLTDTVAKDRTKWKRKLLIQK